MKKTRYNSGTTLIETLIYIGLFGIIMFTSVSSLYYLIKDSEQNKQISQTENESLFINKKIDFILNEKLNITIEEEGKTLVLEKNGLVTTITNIDNNLLISRNSNPAQKLNNAEFKITDVLFEKILQNNNQNGFIKIKYKVENREFTHNSYIKY